MSTKTGKRETISLQSVRRILISAVGEKARLSSGGYDQIKSYIDIIVNGLMKRSLGFARAAKRKTLLFTDLVGACEQSRVPSNLLSRTEVKSCPSMSTKKKSCLKIQVAPFRRLIRDNAQGFRISEQFANHFQEVVEGLVRILLEKAHGLLELSGKSTVSANEVKVARSLCSCSKTISTSV